ncbi:hypothetical protein DERF_001435 [Dermatophagoides farinae]|uniref:Uncharacterized protein n=1 Tax=Dermatophagoides farinae TaxID=6954 RepID=A0A922IBU7_DERFA|nr:hypothetical protein DERF_001435 [Dermatophagoides farinae]
MVKNDIHHSLFTHQSLASTLVWFVDPPSSSSSPTSSDILISFDIKIFIKIEKKKTSSAMSRESVFVSHQVHQTPLQPQQLPQ